MSHSSLHGSPSHWCCFLIGLLPAAFHFLHIRAGMTWMSQYVCIQINLWYSLYDLISCTLNHVPITLPVYIIMTGFGYTLCPTHLCMDSLSVDIALLWSAPCSHHFHSPIPAGMTCMSQCILCNHTYGLLLITFHLLTFYCIPPILTFMLIAGIDILDMF